MGLPKCKKSAEWLGGLTVSFESESVKDSIFTSLHVIAIGGTR
jgi:hypothetical protein